jgi:polysaccharide pyruvyl transferase WcaK-like protein
MKIFLAHPFGELHKGDITVLNSTLMLLKRIPSAEVTFRYKSVRTRALKFIDTLKADFVVFPVRDDLSLTYGFPGDILCGFFFAILLRKPFMLFAAEIEGFEKNFKGKVASCLTSCFLNRADLILVRDRISRQRLLAINVTKPPIYVTADPGFLLKRVSPRQAKNLLSKEGILIKDERIVGVNVSALAYRYAFPEISSPEEKCIMHVNLMSHLIDYIIEKLEARVILLPHVFETGQDDRAIAGRIYQKVTNKDRLNIITNVLEPEELKGIIGLFEMFITTRYHPLIHSTSMHVPTIAIDYTLKMKEIMEDLGCDKWYCHIRNIRFEELISKIDELWINRKDVKKTLQIKVKFIEQRSALNADLLKDFVTRHKLRPGNS